MDPLTVITSVAGLLKAANTIVSLLLGVNRIRNAPRSIERLLIQVKHLEMLLYAVQKFLVGLDSAPSLRTSLIQVDDLVTILTDLVLAFSELDAVARSVSQESGATFNGRWMWHWKEDEVSKIAARLESHKSSLSLMLNIAQWQSDIEAQKAQQTLQALVKEVLQSNADISRRLRAFEERAESQSLLTVRARNEEFDYHWSIEQPKSSSATYTDYGDDISPRSSRTLRSNSSPFEVDLTNSRVYQRTQFYECDVSFAESNVRTHAWSIFSGLSLSEISLVAAIAVPIFETDISNAQCYQFKDLSTLDKVEILKPSDESLTASGHKRWGMEFTPWRDPESAIDSVLATVDPLDSSYANVKIETSLRTRRSYVERMELAQYHRDATIGMIDKAPNTSPSVDKVDEEYDLVIFSNTHLFDERIRVETLGSLSTFAGALYSHAFNTLKNEESILPRRHQLKGDPYSIVSLTLLPTDDTFIGRGQINDSQRFIMAYSCTKRSDFHRIGGYYSQIEVVEQRWEKLGYIWDVQPKYTVLLVGFISHEELDEREVSTKEGQQLALELGCSFFETEPTMAGIEYMFSTLVGTIRRQRIEAAKVRMGALSLQSEGPKGRRHRARLARR